MGLRVGAVVLAAGRSERMGQSKLYLPLDGRPVLVHSLERFARSPLVQELVVVINPAEKERFEREVLDLLALEKQLKVARGGRERQDSALAGVRALSAGIELVLVHDGARPFFSDDLLAKLVAAAGECGAALPAIPVKETIRSFDHEGVSSGELDRGRLFQVQTPQCFSYQLLRRSLEEACAQGRYFTDDAGAVAAISGVRAKLVPGEEWNIKITTPFDLELASVLAGLNKA
ncbi:MAG: 2-C-methyl-D-erythritol 4-phosphate cytidylyltransferase [Candidatus Acetothermia bacterium]|jgi:2-C-methyl-D-erythritol 4-phosphate cytidylyltransferase|nr:2-C-methyl-D-erythritol 4-phosphate cytidylyltransferase [Candidatus Acetothermia bacterium]MDH7504997.1 2-C-methyl-D-erythritol 4-phosphate cytidylyltransferase [Candidatus Acetothermia bacterium]